MRIAVSFVCLCYLLLGGYFIYTYSHYNGIRDIQAEHVPKNQRIKFTNAGQDYPVLKDNSSEEEEFLISDEDEDVNNIPTVYSLPARYYTICSCQALLNYLCSCSETTPVSMTQVSDKYLLQRVLRI